ncbi:MAG: S8 family serine peptidase [Bryobacterales bacterium]|nr:S8 family serine peptidase [Bryobacterales bacterium]
MKPEEIEKVFYGGQNDQERRFTQDFPILPDVWIAFGGNPNKRYELLLTPHTRGDAPKLCATLRARLNQEREAVPAAANSWVQAHSAIPGRPRLLFNESVALAEFSFYELLRVALPLSDWWLRAVVPLLATRTPGELEQLGLPGSLHEATPAKRERRAGDAKLLEKLADIVGRIEYERLHPGAPVPPTDAEKKTAFTELFRGLPAVTDGAGVLFSVSRNRPANTSLWRSRLAVKADAASLLFNLKCDGIRWAVLDTGIDAQHPAFYRRNAQGQPAKPAPDDPEDKFPVPSRVVRTYDFLRLKELLDPDTPLPDQPSAFQKLPPEKQEGFRNDLAYALSRGRAIDWDLLEPFLRIPHHPDTAETLRPKSAHGTHVAGILAGNWPEAVQDTAIEQPLVGICPELELYDLRVLGEGADEFTVMAALQFVRHLNAHKDQLVIHGVNLSMAVPHDVANFACGRTPVCEECERVVASGVVVVTAAGNRGFNKFSSADGGATGDYRYISITDPGNADSVITVGSTHRFMPHTYGVSYFSSRGPTGDGRTKPDLVAPGERIDGPSPEGGYETMDGTSMAAPHVSGAAALLMARHRELVGQPQRIKKILCGSATDLGREPRFQGCGMLDVLRAIQSV